ncbi:MULTISPECIES: mannose-1-phosphate guanylyltransferase [Chryseobacterium]|uniref:Mannose-1-phosphate guanylyltransferase n=1 Tax=Chryseobacterium camelliae TaxID=1265445 RepID=A0ABU0TN01_9FLAO|nr:MULTISPECIES: mannose-1-phosphate guanylyltransferase [Chryseobacterium]MDT3407982.1 mannose-1-phosphate guanylyltransferase [Pseudacidovorax intermedius]MDQ1098161.1 mannose-1-phosphate guanylyltransferase [Chryseobacterium camelliae]MDQ1102091.1 mannose-1-phosphate guanylyltransferase [Chryseobacterium sp. SORGH_AS_1048]MDR6085529.1 mannose-1-phosphate guanylyltransferase [Chryseobacterium sp. SORGH_AS_0909]MDR6129891.1 mannose-1-phosphate guanylyltransferase [Chryseobacterium sp. SORGH_A
MVRSDQYCVIMAGGIGSRFWPMSTQKFPKQFQDILGVGRTMIQQTYDRIRKIVPDENIFVITNKEYVSLSHQQLPEIPEQNIVGEPLAKNTAACNLYMANKIAEINPDAQMIVLPADHLILREEVFLEKASLAFEIASKNDYLITLGITPTRPDTGYGYIQFVDKKGSEYFKIKTFTEKPILEIAKSFLESGDFLWNAGIFVWSVKSILSAFDKYLPEMTQQFMACEYNADGEEGCIELIYPKLQKISIDNGILEKAKNVYVIPSDLGWSDLGTWTSVYENTEKDENQNAVKQKHVLTYHSSGNIVHIKNSNKAVVIDGLKDYIVVDTDKVLMICPREHDQLIKDYVLDLKNLKKGDKFI